MYGGLDLGIVAWPDLVVEDTVVVELKAGDAFLEQHETQLMTTLRLTGKRFGFVAILGAPSAGRLVHRRVR